MAESEIDRKIAVIFVADVVGYSKHMEKDENATFKAYGACEKILNKLLKKFKGSIFNTAGDSVLAEFPSAVNAVECAVDFQNEIKERNASDKTETKLEFRIGINMGDVVQKDGNLLGDGVNIAARLEALSQPNGITISKSVYDLVVPKTKITFNDLGVQKVKQNTFHAYDILLDPSQKRTLKTQSTSNTTIFAGIAAALIIAIAGFFMFNGGEEAKTASSKPTILVSPLNVLSNNDSDSSYGMGITESMISTLSGYQGITVLSSSTSFHTQEAAMTDDQVRNELGVNYIVQGSVQFMGQEGRINLELVDLLAGTVKWSELLDFKKDNIFAAQDDISREILKELSINISTGNRQAANWAADFGNIDIFTEFLNWRIEWAKQNKKGYLKSQMMLDALLEKPLPDVMRYGLPAWQLFQKVSLGLSEDQDSDLKELQSMIKKMDQFQRDEEAYVLKTMVGMYIFNLGCDQAKENIVKAMEIGGNTSDNLNAASRVFIRCGEPKKAIDAARKLLILNPNDTGWGKTKILISYLHVDGQIEEIKKIMEGKLNAPDMHSQILLYFAFLAYKDGDIELANNYFQRASEKTFGLEDFKRTLNIRDNNHEIIQGLVELGLDL